MFVKSFTASGELNASRCVACFAVTAAWCWLVLKGYGDPAPFVFNDEFGGLFGAFPSAILFLCILGMAQGVALNWRLLRLACCAAMCAPVLMGLRTAADIAPILEIGVNVISGFGLAAAITALSMETANLTAKEIPAVTALAILASAVAIELVILMRPETLLLMPIVLALLFLVLLPVDSVQPSQSAGMLSTMHTTDISRGLRKLFFLYFLTGLSFGLYYSLMAVMEPLLPKPRFMLPGAMAAGCLFCAGCIYLACKTAIFRIILLMLPILVVGYTAWPLLHRESPAVSLASLHLAYILLATLALTSIFLVCGRLKRIQPSAAAALTGAGHACLLAGILLGACAMPVIRHSFSSGTNVNHIFVVISITILISSWSYTYLLGKIHFWNMAFGGERKCRQAPQAAASIWEQMETKPEKPKLELSDYEKIFREMGLTKQQAIIASLLAAKQKDDEICSALNISPNTFKTHIRNILKRLDIKSRHELAWLAETRSRAA